MKSNKTKDKNIITNQTNKNESGKIKKFFRGFIPKHVSNKVVVDVYDVLRVFQHASRKDFSKNYEYNRNGFAQHKSDIKQKLGFIEDQNCYTDMKYGKHSIRFCGCEIIATYNALYSIHGYNPIAFTDMIREYESDGMVLSGSFGTSPKAIRYFLERHGYRTEFTTKLSKFDEVASRSDSLILTIYNDGSNIMKAVHTVNVSKANGKYIAHNVYGNGVVAGPFDSMIALMQGINNGRSKEISLIGVSV
ncbi:MAG: hypothetical protein MJ130_02095 [Lachnospiraceae bacterium]|nr:hypothetical protein [Lachnospiraceae bacterium]